MPGPRQPSLPPRRREVDPWTVPLDDQPAATAGRLGREAEPQGLEAVQQQIERLRPVVRRVKRNWAWGLIGVLLATLVVGAYALLVFQPPYKSETVVFYQSDLNPEALGKSAGRVDPTFMRELVYRRGRLEALIHELGLHRDTIEDYGMGVAIAELERDIAFKPVGKSTFRISYIGDSAEEARDVTAWLADNLVEEELGRRRQRALESKDFLEEQLTKATAELAAREKDLGAFIARHPRFATTNNEAAREAKLTGDAAPPRQSAASKTKKRYVMKRVMRKSPGGSEPPAPAPKAKPTPPDPKLVAARQAAIEELTRATRRLSELRADYTDAHPDVASAKARVASAEAAVDEATTALEADRAESIYANAVPEPQPKPAAEPKKVAVRVPVPVPAEPQTSAAADDTAPSLEALAAMPADELGKVEAEWMGLKRAVEEARDRQERLATESFRADVQTRSQDAGHSARVVVLDEAYLPDQPMRSRLFFGKIWAPLAVLLAGLIVIGRALMDDRIYAADDLADLETTPLLSVIPSSH